MDVEEACIKPALKSGNLRLYTEVECERIVTDESGRHVIHVEVRRGNERFTINGSVFVISSGTYNSPALLFRSRSARHPHGLANSSGQLGKNLCGHNAGLLLVPTRRFLDNNHQKTFAINDFYFGQKDFSYPMGIAQATGRFPIWEGMPQPLKWITKTVVQRSLLMLLMAESLPDEHNRIEMDQAGKLILHYKANNLPAYAELKKTFTQVFRKAGYFMTLNAGCMTDKEPWAAIGTARIGNDPEKFVLNKWCQSYDVSNLYIVDGSSLPSNGSLNTSLTLIAQALRVGEHLNEKLRAASNNFSQSFK